MHHRCLTPVVRFYLRVAAREAADRSAFQRLGTSIMRMSPVLSAHRMSTAGRRERARRSSSERSVTTARTLPPNLRESFSHAASRPPSLRSPSSMPTVSSELNNQKSPSRQPTTAEAPRRELSHHGKPAHRGGELHAGADPVVRGPLRVGIYRLEIEVLLRAGHIKRRDREGNRVVVKEGDAVAELLAQHPRDVAHRLVYVCLLYTSDAA